MTNLNIPTNGTCILCDRACWHDKGPIDLYQYHCSHCGSFEITRKALIDDFNGLTKEEKSVLSACTREQAIRGRPQLRFRSNGAVESNPQPGTVCALQVIETMFPRRIQDRLDRVLTNLCAMTSCPGQLLDLSKDTDEPVLFAESEDTADFVLEELAGSGYIDLDSTSDSWEVRVRAAGIARQQELEEDAGRQESLQAFVAMWFNEETEAAYIDGIVPAITDCGFRPLRIDVKETNNKICDEIEAEIRRSRFLVADFTGQRGGVYYEAGLARGLGLEVISSCRKGEEKNLHFDTRQYKHIIWETPEDLRSQLINRIGATIAGARMPERR